MTRCDKCGKYFAGPTNFDAHRTGEYAQPAYKHGNVKHPAKPSTRRCMTTEEMQARGFAEEPHKRWGTQWYLVAKREALLRAYPRKNTISEDEEEDS